MARTHASFIEHNGSIWAVVATATDHVLSASADGTVALHASSTTSAIPEIEGYPSIQRMQANPGARIWTLPRQPLGFVGLSVAVSDPAKEPTPEVARRALCNSMSGKTILVDFGSGEILGSKESLEKDPNTGAMPTEPGTIRLDESISALVFTKPTIQCSQYGALHYRPTRGHMRPPVAARGTSTSMMPLLGRLLVLPSLHCPLDGTSGECTSGIIRTVPRSPCRRKAGRSMFSIRKSRPLYLRLPAMPCAFGC